MKSFKNPPAVELKTLEALVERSDFPATQSPSPGRMPPTLLFQQQIPQ